MSKLISRFEIGFDNDAKATINDLKTKLDAVAHGLSAKNDTHADRLLAAMQADAANDAPQPELKELGQWVFEGQDKKWVSAHVDSDGRAYYCSLKKSNLIAKRKHWGTHCGRVGYYTKLIGEDFDTSNWQNSAINRQPVNDVDYLTSSDPKQKGMPTFIAIDEYDSLSECVPHIDDVLDQSDVLSESVPQITQADMQLIFIKNLSDCLIQRMHSMDRFSEDDYHIGGTNLMPWDIVTGEYNDGVVYGVVTGTQLQANRDTNKIDIVRLKPKFLISENHVSIGAITSIYFDSNDSFCTITEAELPAFRAALEACYA